MPKRPAAVKPGATKNKHLPAKKKKKKKKKKLLVAEVHKEGQDILTKALEAFYGNSNTSTNIQFELFRTVR